MLKNAIRVAFAGLERLALPKTAASKYPPLFIVGPPRAGTTLIYLLIVHRFRVSYISNFLAMMPQSPVLLGRLARVFSPLKGPGDFFNNYGETHGWRGPNQGYRLWNAWLPTDSDYISPDRITLGVRRGLRRMVAGIEGINGAPFVNKWQRNAARIEGLDSIFPEALFLRITRDHTEVAQSLLKGRRELNRDIGQWFSARPVDMPDVASLSPVEQVSCQAVLMDRQIARDLAVLGEGRFFTLSYEDLCADPEAALDGAAAWYAARTGHRLDLDNPDLPPLSERRGRKVSEEVEAEIEQICARIWGEVDVS